MSEASAHMPLNFEADCEPNVVRLEPFGTVNVTFLPCASALIQSKSPHLAISLNPDVFKASLQGHEVAVPEDAPPLNIYASAYPRQYGEPPMAYIVRDEDGKIVERNLLVSLIKHEDIPPRRPKPARKHRIPEKYNLKRKATKRLGEFAWSMAEKIVDSKLATKIAGPVDETQPLYKPEEADLTEGQILLSTIDVLNPSQELDDTRQRAVGRVVDVNTSFKETTRGDIEGLGAGIATLSTIAVATLVFTNDPAPRFIVPALAAAGIGVGLKAHRESLDEYHARYEEKVFTPNPEYRDWPEEALVFARAIRQKDRLFSFTRR